MSSLGCVKSVEIFDVYKNTKYHTTKEYCCILLHDAIYISVFHLIFYDYTLYDLIVYMQQFLESYFSRVMFWVAKENCDHMLLLIFLADEFDAYIIVSFVNATLVLSIGDTVEEVTDSGFLGTTPTLCCSSLGDDALVQVSDSSDILLC